MTSIWDGESSSVASNAHPEPARAVFLLGEEYRAPINNTVILGSCSIGEVLEGLAEEFVQQPVGLLATLRALADRVAARACERTGRRAHGAEAVARVGRAHLGESDNVRGRLVESALRNELSVG